MCVAAGSQVDRLVAGFAGRAAADIKQPLFLFFVICTYLCMADVFTLTGLTSILRADDRLKGGKDCESK